MKNHENSKKGKNVLLKVVPNNKFFIAFEKRKFRNKILSFYYWK